eukprot:scaffold1659_cov371-Prasinococcus_capsulatus_cf.AAC.18
MLSTSSGASSAAASGYHGSCEGPTVNERLPNHALPGLGHPSDSRAGCLTKATTLPSRRKACDGSM